MERFFKDGSVFGMADERDRSRILRNIRDVRCMIPSLLTFFESLKYIEPCTRILSMLTPKAGARDSIKDGLYACYKHHDKETVCIEFGDNDLRPEPSSGFFGDRDWCYQMLWLAAMRNFVALGNVTTKKEQGQAKPTAAEPNPTLKRALGDLAYRLGFRSDTINNWRETDSARLLIGRLIKDSTGRAPESEVETIDQIAGILKRMTNPKPDLVQCKLTNDEILPIARRFGRPYENDYAHDRKFLYLPSIYIGIPSTRERDVASFYCTRDMFIHFLGIDLVGYAACNDLT